MKKCGICRKPNNTLKRCSCLGYIRHWLSGELIIGKSITLSVCPDCINREYNGALPFPLED